MSGEQRGPNRPERLIATDPIGDTMTANHLPADPASIAHRQTTADAAREHLTAAGATDLLGPLGLDTPPSRPARTRHGARRRLRSHGTPADAHTASQLARQLAAAAAAGADRTAIVAVLNTRRGVTTMDTPTVEQLREQLADARATIADLRDRCRCLTQIGREAADLIEDK